MCEIRFFAQGFFMVILLPDLAATCRLGHALGNLLAKRSRLLPVFFYGELGSGKTTLICAMVAALPGGEDAETSSPSFTLCNMYATSPPVAHFDVYRQEDGSVDESLLDFLDGERHLVLVEWAERLPEYALPPERLACEIMTDRVGRRVRLTAYGQDAVNFLEEAEPALCSHTVFSLDNP
ncbi:MAG: tRNA (adenosine(37)-N6)-threonylcarbamoyltransferase complex ATPase subunit type 1 TsaE [Deltaproteobacteria bacterium]|nr:tRNA (adenosine(37)-N6)-threonylcarbamoyltransferase complex ATPase subunit type 1 TsaE [Deltaproteobacteria bacterium]